jgi:hypothetical protein
MMNEILQMRGRLSTAQQEFERLDVLVSGDLMIVRQLIDPFESDVTKLEVDQAFAAMERLKDNVHRMRELKDQIDKIKKALGE